MAEKAPRMAMGTMERPHSMESRAVPWRNRCTQPSRDRVPSGNTRRFHPSPTRRRAVSMPRPDETPAPCRSMGKVLKTSAVDAARHLTSKK